MIPNWLTGYDSHPHWNPHAGLCLCDECTSARQDASAGLTGRDQAEFLARRLQQIIADQEARQARGKMLLASGYLYVHGEREPVVIEGSAPSGEPVRVAQKFVHQGPPLPGAFDCPGCGFRFRSAPETDTSCQYCGTRLAAVKPAAAPAPVRSLEDGIRDALAEFDAWMLTEPELPGWMARGEPEPGRCQKCRLGRAVRGGKRLCTYCLKLAELEAQAPAAEPAQHRFPFTDTGFSVTVVGVIAFWVFVLLVLLGWFR